MIARTATMHPTAADLIALCQADFLADRDDSEDAIDDALQLGWEAWAIMHGRDGAVSFQAGVSRHVIIQARAKLADLIAAAVPAMTDDERYMDRIAQAHDARRGWAA